MKLCFQWGLVTGSVKAIVVVVAFNVTKIELLGVSLHAPQAVRKRFTSHIVSVQSHAQFSKCLLIL